MPVPQGDDGAALALRALALVAGTARGDEDAVDLHVDAFDSVEEAAGAFAHLGGYLLAALCQARGESPAATVAWLGRTIDPDAGEQPPIVPGSP